MVCKTLTRADLAEAVVRQVGLPRNESQELVELVLKEISSSLAGGEPVKLSSFGSFGIREKGERVGRNPKNRAGSSHHAAQGLGVQAIQYHEGPHQHRHAQTQGCRIG